MNKPDWLIERTPEEDAIFQKEYLKWKQTACYVFGDERIPVFELDENGMPIEGDIASVFKTFIKIAKYLNFENEEENWEVLNNEAKTCNQV